MTGVMQHLFQNYAPLFMQALMGIKKLYNAKPIAIHVFGKPATGDLKRPFKAAGVSDAAAIEEVEKGVSEKEECAQMVLVGVGPWTVDGGW
ncbi:hypothetical protein CVT25_006244 [Psilocybe cyanescens]|uniref:Uncharacterized protein n=1 Tax=Psilocybe cyanescens TaxID=93625 RepID=A0A409XKJ9_PSICY|nr:hypothetical protein CVT25_006244 [Psilocybe cyanescens]